MWADPKARSDGRFCYSMLKLSEFGTMTGASAPSIPVGFGINSFVVEQVFQTMSAGLYSQSMIAN